MLVTAIVATQNRCRSLQTCLAHLWHSAEELGDCEVIVVDNGSSDGTREMVMELEAETPAIIRYMFEGRRGKSRALNTGIAAAKGEIIAFTDDDCYVSEKWFRSIANEFMDDSSLGGVGGQVELFNDRDARISLRSGQKKMWVQSASDALYLLMGCNMAFRKQIFEKVGGFDCNLGPGTNVVAEDIDFLYRVYRSGEKLAYVPEITLQHDHGRSAAQAEKVNERYVRGRGALFGKHIRQGDGMLVRQAYWEMRNRLQAAFRSGRFGREIRSLYWLLSGMTLGFGMPEGQDFKERRPGQGGQLECEGGHV